MWKSICSGSVTKRASIASNERRGPEPYMVRGTNEASCHQPTTKRANCVFVSPKSSDAPFLSPKNSLSE
eukprot:1112379-Prymnesium_polylepis.1